MGVIFFILPSLADCGRGFISALMTASYGASQVIEYLAKTRLPL